MCMMFTWDPVMFSEVRGAPSLTEILQEEFKLLVFAHWLGTDYAYSTVVQYL